MTYADGHEVYVPDKPELPLWHEKFVELNFLAKGKGLEILDECRIDSLRFVQSAERINKKAIRRNGDWFGWKDLNRAKEMYMRNTIWMYYF